MIINNNLLIFFIIIIILFIIHYTISNYNEVIYKKNIIETFEDLHWHRKWDGKVRHNSIYDKHSPHGNIPSHNHDDIDTKDSIYNYNIPAQYITAAPDNKTSDNNCVNIPSVICKNFKKHYPYELYDGDKSCSDLCNKNCNGYFTHNNRCFTCLDNNDEFRTSTITKQLHFKHVGKTIPNSGSDNDITNIISNIKYKNGNNIIDDIPETLKFSFDLLDLNDDKIEYLKNNLLEGKYILVNGEYYKINNIDSFHQCKVYENECTLDSNADAVCKEECEKTRIFDVTKNECENLCKKNKDCRGFYMLNNNDGNICTLCDDTICHTSAYNDDITEYVDIGQDNYHECKPHASPEPTYTPEQTSEEIISQHLETIGQLQRTIATGYFDIDDTNKIIRLIFEIQKIISNNPESQLYMNYRDELNALISTIDLFATLGQSSVATTQPATTQPATTQPTTTQPTTTQPATTQPTTTQPTTTQPATTQPTTTQPSTTQPATTQPATTQPTTTQPATTQPATTQPTTTQPTTTQPATTQPVTTQPTTTQPATTQPATTQPATTQPSTTQPATTQPSTTQPATTQPSTTPVVTAPVVTCAERLSKCGDRISPQHNWDGDAVWKSNYQCNDIYKGTCSRTYSEQNPWGTIFEYDYEYDYDNNIADYRNKDEYHPSSAVSDGGIYNSKDCTTLLEKCGAGEARTWKPNIHPDENKQNERESIPGYHNTDAYWDDDNSCEDTSGIRKGKCIRKYREYSHAGNKDRTFSYDYDLDTAYIDDVEMIDGHPPHGIF